MRVAKLLIVAFTTFFVFALITCEGGDTTDISGLDDDSNADDDEDNDDDDDIFDDDSQFEDDDNEGDDDDDSDVMDGCDGVDFLFIIDNSISMGDEHKNLIASFPGFIDAITAAVDVNNYHIMAVDSDAKYGGLKAGLQDCNDRLGAGQVGQNLEQNCAIAGGNRYLIKDQPDLYDAFACIANVGVEGNGYEKAMEAMVKSVNKENQPGGCNAGFLRESAILVLVFITDEDEQCTEVGEQCSDGDPASWKKGLVDAMGGKERNMVVLGVFGDNDLDDGICLPYDDDGNGAMPAPLLRTFLESFDEDRRHYCSVCELDYTECFMDAVSVIDTTCEEIE